jgi:16S rRNA (guanine966-N2)-methyltransferase
MNVSARCSAVEPRLIHNSFVIVGVRQATGIPRSRRDGRLGTMRQETDNWMVRGEPMRRRRASDSRLASRAGAAPRAAGDGTMRIVGGRLRGRRLAYSGDERVRPMKDRTREAVFNLLGPSVRGTVVWDLFAGTGAMGLEAISRGADRATLIERHIPTAKIIEQNVQALNLTETVRVVRADTFHWAEVIREDPASPPWLLFCSPPYALYRERFDSLRQLLATLRDASPTESQIVVEAERPFDFSTLWPGDWTTREYAPAAIGIFRT